MPAIGPAIRPRPLDDTPLFVELRHRARLLERSVYGLVALVAVAPPLAFLGMSLRQKLAPQQLLSQLAVIVAIHFVVAAALGIAFYRAPIRALRQAIGQLEETRAQLIHSEKLAAIGEIYAGLTHEVNNPLGVILARVRLMLAAAEEQRLPPETVKDLEVIERHGGRIAAIVRALLAFARKGEVSQAPVDLNTVVSDVVALVERPFVKQGITIRTELARPLPAVDANRDQLQQVFLNLLNNARDEQPKGGHIAVRTAVEDGRVVAEVEDGGPGLSPAAQEHLFEPFFTTKAVGKGTGLGLSVSYGIVKAHGGDIEAHAGTGGGAVFRLSLPVGARR